MPRPLISQKDFKDQIRAKLGDGVLDLSEAVYKGRRRTVTVVCLQNPEHGASTLLAGNLLKGRGCPKCGLEQRIERSKTALAAIRAARPQRDPKPKPSPRPKPSLVAINPDRAPGFENADEPKNSKKRNKPDKLNESDIFKRPQLEKTEGMERAVMLRSHKRRLLRGMLSPARRLGGRPPTGRIGLPGRMQTPYRVGWIRNMARA
jgi:hypothetical protein